jgi:cytosine/adenosine deaminase-related metal-dependent hydrolase
MSSGPRGSADQRLLLRARLVVPVAQPPIENGVVEIQGQRITLVDRWPASSSRAHGRVFDLGEVILLPGLINAHCHLDYTRVAGQIPPLKCFTDWIKAIVALKAAWSYSEFAESWLAGAGMLVRTGTTTVADIETVPELIPDVWPATPLRVVSFRELIHLQGGSAAEEVVCGAVSQWASLPRTGSGLGLSPHAPYSTTGSLLRSAAREARTRQWRLSTHLAESEEEFDMFRYARGPLHHWLESQRPMQDCGHVSPVRYLAGLNYLGSDLLAVHVNYLDHGDAALLARHQVHVVHCPRSHAYFRHKPFPRQELTQAGVNLCLGTDSLASVNKRTGGTVELNLFSEMTALARAAPELTPLAILRTATVNGAQALGWAGELGELTAGALADLIAVPYDGEVDLAVEGLIHYPGEVCSVMMRGGWVLSPGQSWPRQAC